MTAFSESVVEQAAFAWLESTGWSVRNGAVIAPGEPAAERDDYGQVALAREFQGFELPLFPAVDRVAIGAEREVLELTVARGARCRVTRTSACCWRKCTPPGAGRIGPPRTGMCRGSTIARWF